MLSLKKNISSGIVLQLISTACIFLQIPISINYLGIDNYGLWVVFYSVLMLVMSFDLGLPNSFRNLLIESLTNDDKNLTDKIVSTTYFSFLLISIIIFFLIVLLYVFFGNSLISFLPLGLVILVIFTTIIDYNFKLSLSIFTAHQYSFIFPLSTSALNTLFLIEIFLFNYFDLFIFDSKLYTFCILFPITSLIVNSCISLICFGIKFPELLPKTRSFSTKLIKPLLFSGAAFFVIQLSIAALNQLSTLLIFSFSTSQFIAEVSIYDRVFGIISFFGAVLFFPFWPKFTEKHSNGDYAWIKNTIKKLELFFILVLIFTIILIYMMPFILKFWLNEEVEFNFLLSVLIALKYVFILFNSIYSYFLNAIGKLKIQIYCYSISACLLIPFSSILNDFFGPYGIILYSVIVFVVMSISQKIFTNIYLNKAIN